MLKKLSVALYGVLVAGATHAGPLEDCEQSNYPPRVIKGCSMVLRQDPGNVVAYYKRGLGHVDTRSFDLAIADFDKAIELDPKHAKAFDWRSTAYLENGDSGRALADLEKAIEVESEACPRLREPRQVILRTERLRSRACGLRQGD